MNALVNAAAWVVGKALAPVGDSVLEDWAASAGLGPNVKDLEKELRYTKAMLEPWTRRREIGDNPTLKELLQMLRDKAYDADDVLDELDYFRIQDVIDGTSEAADEHAKGCCCNLLLNTRHTAKAAVGKLLCSSACSPAATPGARRVAGQSDGMANAEPGCMRKLISGACNTVRHVGKRLPCSSLPPVRHDDDGDHSAGILTIPPSGAATHEAPQRENAPEAPKLEFNRVDISKRMSLITRQLREHRREISEILRTIGSSSNTAPDIAQSRPITISESIEPKLYGRDLIMNSIIHDITQGEYRDKNLTVLPIVGPGGIGKTTLAQHIYQSQEVQKHFQVKVWECVSLNFNVDKITKDIEKYIPKVQDETIGTTEELIGQRLKSKRFLLVLDDMWECSDEDEWKRLLLPLKKSQLKGNIIIVTTRRPALAEMIKTTQSPTELEGLDREAFKELFLAFVFGEEQCRHDQNILLIETGYRIMDKLKGSPLAAKTVGRLLRNNLDLDYWTGVLESKEWQLSRKKSDIMPALKLSYDYLPFDLQQCFSYCALFPQDYKFETKELIYFWIGHDILHSGDGNDLSLEDMGLRKINDLVSHGFLKKEKTEIESHYIIHDLLHELALIVASHDCFTLHLGKDVSGNIGQSVRHLSITLNYAIWIDEKLKSMLRKSSTRLKIGNLRSLMIFGDMQERFANIFKEFFGEANALRLLYLPEPMGIESNLLTAVHLRYLNLGRSSGQNLPSILPRFYHLKILDLGKWYGHKHLPKDMSNLVNLSHFLAPNDDLCSSISYVGKLKYLQELKMFRVNKESRGFELMQLRNLIELRELGIYNMEKIETKEEAIEAKLMDKKYLRKLTLVWDEMQPNMPFYNASVLESLEPPRKLLELSIRGHGGRYCPTWMGAHISSTLQSLHLAGVAWEGSLPLERMWALQKLTLEDIPNLKEFGSSRLGDITELSFRKLKEIRLMHLHQLEKLVLGDTCHLLSQLEKLTIIWCPKLLGLPFDNIFYPRKHDLERELDWFPMLQVLNIFHCPKVMSLPPVPWTQTLSYVSIRGVGSTLLEHLKYDKSTLVVTGKDYFQMPHFSLLHRKKEGGNGVLRSLEQLLAFNNLKDLQQLRLTACPPLQSKNLQMLASLKELHIEDSSHVLKRSESEGEVRRHLPVEKLRVKGCGGNGKELTELIYHLSKLRELEIFGCEKITRMGVALEHQDPTANILSPSPSALTKDGTQATYHKWHTTMGVDKEEKIDEGMLIFPAPLCDSLEKLHIAGCPELSLVASTFRIDNTLGGVDIVGCRSRVQGGLQALQSLVGVVISACPNIFATDKTSFSSSCCPFPSSLQNLELHYLCMGTLEPLSNLTALRSLALCECGDDLMTDGWWPLVTKLSHLEVRARSNSIYGWILPDEVQILTQILDWDPTLELRDGDGRYKLRRDLTLELRDGDGRYKLRQLETDDVARVLAAPICSLLSSSLVMLVCFDQETEHFTQEQEEALLHLTSLQKLQFVACDKLQCLPAGLHRLSNLKMLEIRACPAITTLPKDGLPSSLQHLEVYFCGNEELKKQCRNYVQSHPQISSLI
ncbi:hypothetical protein EJB05_39320, partial [Eragrostis curvula]